MDWKVLLIVVVSMFAAVRGIKNGVVLPNDPYIYIGNNLTLMCNLTRFNTDYNSQFLTFSRHNDQPLPSQYIEITSTRSIVLRYPIKSPEDGGNYLCKLNRTGSRGEIIGNQIVEVEYGPRKVRQIDCRVYNWENMTCYWDLGVEFVSPRNMDIKLIWTISQAQFECPHQTMTACSWWAVDGADSFRSDVTYYMGVSIENLRTQKMILPPTITVDTSKIVEPAPVTDLTAKSNSSCVVVSWRHEKVSREKIYKVEFKAEGEMDWKTKHVDSATSLNQCDLHPNMVYFFSVTCKPLVRGKAQGFWSKETVISIRTKEGVPTEAPRILAGSYTEMPCPVHDSCKTVMLFWQPLAPSSANGEITQYRIDYKSLTSHDWQSQSEPGTIYQDGEKKENSKGRLFLMHGNSYLIQLRAMTKVGESKVFSQILIPPLGQKPEAPEVIVEGYNESHSTVVAVRWEQPRVWSSQYWQNISSYTVFWCRGYRISTSCRDPLQWREVGVTDTSTELLVDALDDYLFGVAVNALTWSGETISSGILWNSCTYIKNIKPEHAPDNVRLSSYQPDLGLSMEWERLTCGDTHAFIRNYIVNICPSSHGFNCTGEHTSYLLESSVSHYTVDGLRRDHRYKVWVNAAAEGGVSPDSEKLFAVVVDRSLKTGEIAGIVIGGLFMIIILLFGIILCTRRVYKVVKHRYFAPVPIDLPSTLPPLPPIPMPPRTSSQDSDSSDTIYEKIGGPPSPCSSTDSNSGVEAPLIQNKWKFAVNLKNHIYGSRKEQRDSNDSGRGSLSHSADTLLMRLHPSHLRKSKNKKNKEKNKSESDSGVITELNSCGRGQVAVVYHNDHSNSVAYNNTQLNSGFQEYGQDDYQSHSCMCRTGQSDSVDCHSNQVPMEGDCQTKKNTGEANPYSCVDIVDKINSASEKLKRKLLMDQFCDRASGIKQSNIGSTLSLPPSCLNRAGLLGGSLDFRTKSADNELDLEENKLSCMSEAKEYDTSDAYSEDGTLDSVGDVEQEETSAGACSSAQQPMTSYIQFKDKETLEPCVGGVKSAIPTFNVVHDCHCDCKSKLPMPSPDGYVTEALMNQAGCTCAKNEQTLKTGGSPVCNKTTGIVQDSDIIRSSLRPVSQVLNLPPHFFGSMSAVPVDPSNTTEL